jgi:hypothetical protein
MPNTGRAQLDFEQEVIVIPEMHEVEPYIWRTSMNPWAYRLSLQYDKRAVAGNDIDFTFQIRSKTGESLSDMHVFITDKRLTTYRHVRPVLSDGQYRMTYNPPWAGKYRFEIVFRAADEWIRLSKNVKIKGSNKEKMPDERLTDAGYSVKIIPIPEQIYADHVTTFIYEFRYNGEPLTGIEKLNGVDMQAAVWDETRRFFMYATPKQNPGRSDAAISMVFTSPREYTIFAEFKHNGKIQRIRHVIDVLEEKIKKRGRGLSFGNDDLFK